MQEDNIMQEPTRLNEQQLEMLRLFKNPFSNEDYKEIKRLLVKILARNIDNEMGRLEKEKGLTNEVYEQWGKEHMRTPYKQ
jgi:hypothetical protein